MAAIQVVKSGRGWSEQSSLLHLGYWANELRVRVVGAAGGVSMSRQ